MTHFWLEFRTCCSAPERSILSCDTSVTPCWVTTASVIAPLNSSSGSSSSYYHRHSSSRLMRSRRSCSQARALLIAKRNVTPPLHVFFQASPSPTHQTQCALSWLCAAWVARAASPSPLLLRASCGRLRNAHRTVLNCTFLRCGGRMMLLLI